MKSGIIAQIYNFSAWKAETGGLGVCGQCGPNSKTLISKPKPNQNQKAVAEAWIRPMGIEPDQLICSN